MLWASEGSYGTPPGATDRASSWRDHSSLPQFEGINSAGWLASGECGQAMREEQVCVASSQKIADYQSLNGARKHIQPGARKEDYRNDPDRYPSQVQPPGPVSAPKHESRKHNRRQQT